MITKTIPRTQDTRVRVGYYRPLQALESDPMTHPMPTERPNILFLMSDEHRADVAGFAGDDVVRTPILDELARTGVVFTNAYTPSPICIPGRQAMMAGKFPRNCGCEHF